MKNIFSKKSNFSLVIFFVSSFFLFVVSIPNAKAYDPPIGIPAPSFGIDETHTMYVDQRFDFDGDSVLEEGEEYKDAGNGPYTHYIDVSSINCNDTANVFGTQEAPRCTIPGNIPAGSVIELHGGPYVSVNVYDVLGTASQPVFIRGYSALEKTTINGHVVAISRSSVSVQRSSYVVIENLLLDGSSLTGLTEDRNSALSVGDNSHYISFRDSEVTGYPAPDFCPELDRACWFTSLLFVGGDIENTSANVVFYRNYIHNNADTIWPPTYELGRHGFMVLSSAEYVWILDNHITRSGDDGVQVYWRENGNDGPPAHHVYIGNNEIHDMGENALDIKQSADVILSQNKLYNFSKSNQIGAGSDGSAIVLNGDDYKDYGFRSTRFWVLNNEIYDSNVGIRSEASGDIYILGNEIYDIVRHPSYSPPITAMQSGCGVETKSATHLTVANNTLNRVDGGIYIINTLTSEYDISNNIISHLNETTGHALYNNSDSVEMFNNLIYIDNGNITPFKKVLCTDCVIDNPLYAANDDYRLQQLSPAIDSGRVVNAYTEFSDLYEIDISRDMNGTSRPQNLTWDIGAYEYQNLFRADVDNSSAITTTDALLTLRNSLGLSMTGTAWQSSMTTGDVNCDGVSNSTDALLILRYSLGLNMSETGWCE